MQVMQCVRQRRNRKEVETKGIGTVYLPCSKVCKAYWPPNTEAIAVITVLVLTEFHPLFGHIGAYSRELYLKTEYIYDNFIKWCHVSHEYETPHRYVLHRGPKILATPLGVRRESIRIFFTRSYSLGWSACRTTIMIPFVSLCKGQWSANQQSHVATESGNCHGKPEVQNVRQNAYLSNEMVASWLILPLVELWSRSGQGDDCWNQLLCEKYRGTGFELNVSV